MTPAANAPITAADILAPDAYERTRAATRNAMIALKRRRRVAVGPHVTVFFECRDTMLYQIQEMLRAERGGEAQLAGELEAYNSLVPGGGELVATLMIEIDDERLRHMALSGLGGIEEMVSLAVDGEEIAARPETEVERTTAEGNTSAVHFQHFPFRAQIERFRRPGARVVLAVAHPAYAHMAVLSPDTVAALAGDFC
jgi:hypothetical protein